MNFKSACAFFLVASVFSASTVAQTPATAPDSTPTSATDSTVQLDPLVILAERGESPTIPTADPARAEIRLTPGGGEVIEAERYLRDRASTVEDTFALSPGLIGSRESSAGLHSPALRE